MLTQTFIKNMRVSDLISSKAESRQQDICFY